MAGTKPTTACLVSLMAGTTILFSLHHTYKFDKCRCLIPKKKEWFRVLLTWMLLLCQIFMFVWGTGFCYLKYKFGWMMLPQIGAYPIPEMFYPPPYDGYVMPLGVMMNVAYSLQVALNAEEGLYWYHLMRAVRRPQSASSWLGSKVFYVWIFISVVGTAIQCSIGWVGDRDPSVQISREVLCGGVLEFLVLCSASIVVFRFPQFLKDVQASGAGPEVRARLHFYHEANKVRTFLRLLFVATLLILGIDGLTKEKTITLFNHDILTMLCVMSFFFVLMISMVLYLPRDRKDKRQVMVMPSQRPAVNPVTSGFALMSLLREGGQWDDDDDLRVGLPVTDDKEWSLHDKPLPLPLPSAIGNFISPIPQSGQTPERHGPVEIRVKVEHQIHRED